MVNLIELFTTQSLLGLFVLFLFGSLVSLVLFKWKNLCRQISLLFASLGCVAGVIAGLMVLLGTPVSALNLGTFAPIGNLTFSIDALSGFFVLLISIVGLAVSIYSINYMKEYQEKGYSNAMFGFLYNIFILSMIAVVISQNALLFLIFWELMALSSFFLVTYESKEEKAKDAGFIYLLITHIGAVALILMFLVFTGFSGNMDFSGFRTVSLTPMLANVIFVLAIIAFASKAGLMPFHTWLPEAHPQAPSNVSALMSAVMLKVAIYGIIRVLFDFLGTTPFHFWWGILLLLLAAISCIFAVLYAIIQRDLKRLLAYSSVENVGIIFLGIGSAVLFHSLNMDALAALSLFAALYHSLNHALFKSLLFTGAGAVVYTTHTKDMNAMGGLIKRMPVVAVLFFVGVAAISALPPLNGFASEWTMFQALLSGLGLPKLIAFLFGAVVLVLAFTSALALATFVKAFGMVFLGLGRSEKVEHAHEVGSSMHAGMIILVIGCLIAGIFPAFIFSILNPVFSKLSINDLSGVSKIMLGLPSFGILLVLLGSILGVFVLLWITRVLTKAKDETRVTWDCGIQKIEPKMEYTPDGFSMPIQRALNRWLNPLNTEKQAYGPAFFQAVIYKPIENLFMSISKRSAVFQTGKLLHYLMYMLIVMIAILIYAVTV